MKRREFLKNSAGMISLVVPAVLHANQKPCPPSRVGVSGGTAVNVSCVSPADVESDWLARSKGPGVVWAHDFQHQEELTNFLKIGADLTPDHPGGLMPQRVPAGVGGGYCLKFTNFGSTLSKSILPTDTQIELVDAADFPDPQNGRYPYRVVLQIDRTVDKQSNRRENVSVIAKNGRVLTVERATTKSKEAMPWSAGTAIGWDCEGQWARPMSAFKAGSNGLPYDDPASGGTMVRRTYTVKSGDAQGVLWNFREGYWGHKDYHAKYPTWLGKDKPWNGDNFYIQFRVKIDRQRFTPDNDAGGKLFFLHATGGGTTQLIGKMFAKGPDNKLSTEFGMFTNYGNGPSGQSLLREPQGGGRGSQLQPGSGFEGCVAGANPLDCWEWPVDEWVTVLLRVKPGHHNDHRYGLGNAGAAPKGSILVDTSAFKPTNDGNAIEFETNLVPKPDEYDFPGKLDNAAAAYFKNWAGVFPEGSLSEQRYKVVSYGVVNGRAHWRIVPFRDRDILPAGTPSSGDAFGVEWGDLAESAKYKDTIIEAWVARADEKEYARVFSKSDIVYLFGTCRRQLSKDIPPLLISSS
jgi:hypothetical protein